MADWDRVISGPLSQMRESIVRLIPLSLQLQAQVTLELKERRQPPNTQ